MYKNNFTGGGIVTLYAACRICANGHAADAPTADCGAAATTQSVAGTVAVTLGADSNQPGAADLAYRKGSSR